MSNKATQIDFLIAGFDNAKGGTVTAYAAGTTDLKTIWLDRDKATPAANPYTLNASRGAAQLYGDGMYKFVIKDSTGQVITGGTLDNIAIGMTDGPWVDVASYASLTAAVAAIGSTETTLLIDGETTLTAHTTIPATLHLQPTGKALISMGAYDLTINSPFRYGLSQIFSGTGAVSFAVDAVAEVYPEWWTANATPGTTDMWSALQAAVNTNAKVVLQGTTYAISKPLESTRFNLHGAGVGSSLSPDGSITVIHKTTHTVGTHADVAGWTEHYNVDSVLSIVAVPSNYSYNSVIRGISLQGVSDGSRNTHIIYAPRTAKLEISNVDVSFGTNGFYTFGTWTPSFTLFTGYNCDTFIKTVVTAGEQLNTSWTANGMGAKNCAIGYDIYGLNYACFNSSYAEGSTTKAWRFNVSKNIVLNGCGGEDPTGQLISVETSDVTLNGWQSGTIVGANGVEAIYVNDSNLNIIGSVFQDFSAVNGAKNMTVTGAGSPSTVKIINSVLPVSGAAYTVDGYSTVLNDSLTARTGLRGKTSVENAYAYTATDTTTEVVSKNGVIDTYGVPTYEYTQINNRVFFGISIPSVVASGAGAGTLILSVPFVLTGTAYGTAAGSGAAGSVSYYAASQIRVDIPAAEAGTTTWYLTGSFAI